MVEPEYSVFPGGDTPDQDQPPASTEDQSLQRVFGSESMVMKGSSLDSSVIGSNRERMYKIIDEIEENTSSFLTYSIQEMGLIEKSISERLRVLEVKEIESEALETKLGLLFHSVAETFEGLKSEFKEEAHGLYNSIQEKVRELEKAEIDFDLKQRVETEKLNKESMELEAKKNELDLLEEAIREKTVELKRKEETFELKQKQEAEKWRDETELKSKDLAIKKKNDQERSKQQLIDAETRKRSNLELETPLLVENDSDDADSITRLAKKHKSQEADSACELSVNTDLAAKQNSDANDGDIGGMISTDKSGDDTMFNDFSKSVSSFAVDQVWALHDPRDDMPRIYAQIKHIFRSTLSLHVTLLEHVKTTTEQSLIPRACGRFKYGYPSFKSHLMFAQEMHHIKCGQDIIVNPRKGETWALFRDWDVTWNTQPDPHEPPYRYDFVKVISEFDDRQGIEVELISAQQRIINIVIPSEEMQRFSHKVASCIGEEKKGVPAGSTVQDQVGSTDDLAIITD